MDEFDQKIINDEVSLDIIEEDDIDSMLNISVALANKLRLKILNRLSYGPVSIPDLAKIFYTSLSTMVYHTETLKKAHLINIQLIPTKTGSVRMCYPLIQKVELAFTRKYNLNSLSNEIVYTCGVGDYIEASKGIDINYVVDQDKMFIDRPNAIFLNDRHDAKLLWTRNGTITYAFPNEFIFKQKTDEIEVSMEICSEALNYNNKYRSDITFWINDVELFTWECPGDFGDRPGMLSPAWWQNNKIVTQYGRLVTFFIRKDGVYFDDTNVNPSVKISNLHLKSGNKLTLKIGNKADTKHPGGFNIFGKDFGDYPIDITLIARQKLSEAFPNAITYK